MSMNGVIADLVNRFERGGLTRRQLIEGLSALVAAAGTSTQASAQASGLQATGINHTSVLVTDLPRSADFYARVFGLKTVSEDKPNKILRLGTGGSGVASTLVSLRQQAPAGTIDHFAISVQGFTRDSATQVLKQHGLTPADNVEFGFHVKDPDGAVVQIVA
jgi:catechol 2,3-dioxygenase-like lactoylglutathione lyase family enzyme